MRTLSYILILWFGGHTLRFLLQVPPVHLPFFPSVWLKKDKLPVGSLGLAASCDWSQCGKAAFLLHSLPPQLPPRKTFTLSSKQFEQSCLFWENRHCPTLFNLIQRRISRMSDEEEDLDKEAMGRKVSQLLIPFSVTALMGWVNFEYKVNFLKEREWEGTLDMIFCHLPSHMGGESTLNQSVSIVVSQLSGPLLFRCHLPDVI